MIKIEKIYISKFRGIINLELEPKGENFAACGPNGTGKSGIVDAIEFVLTGNLSRLSGRGTKDLSVKLHGPHVDFQKKPDEASVKLNVSIPSLNGKKASITRSVKDLKAPVIEPADADVIAVFNRVELHPEFVLSRRELIRYIIAEPGERSEEVQALLRLDHVEKLRGVLNKISNACKRDLPVLERAEKGAVKPLQDVLGIEPLTKAAIIAAVNPKRAAINLPVLEDLTSETSISDGIERLADETKAKTVPKGQAAKDVQSLKEALAKLNDGAFRSTCAELEKAVSELAGDAEVADGVKREGLLSAALELYDNEHCPVCDTPFDPESFGSHLKEKLRHLAAATKKRKEIEDKLKPLLEAIMAAGTALRIVMDYTPLFEPKPEQPALSAFRQTLRGRYEQLQKVLPLDYTAKVLGAGYDTAALGPELGSLDDLIAALPELNVQAAAREFLLVGQERLEHYRNARKEHQAAKGKAALAEKVYSVYGETTTKALEDVYEQVQRMFADYYREINKTDEGAFTARLIPSLGKLGFNVDFYGRGEFSPGAFHSEGHQDGMGICLYLAIMNHLLNENFTFAVLDDVLMSVDRGHRREVCALLKKQFPNTQFIMTTHDDVWLRHMKSEGLIKGKNFAHFKTWTVDVGPAEWTNTDIWEEIDNYLVKNEVASAAHALRHYLEYFSGEMCHRLRGKVEYRGDGNFGFADLMTGAAEALQGCFKKAKAAANSWGKKEEVEKIAARDEAFGAARQAAELDKWQLNAGVHYNPWADLTKEDFLPVVAAQRAFAGQFCCNTCGERLYVLPEYKTKTQLKCKCGDSSLNLEAKPGGNKVSGKQKAQQPDAPAELG